MTRLGRVYAIAIVLAKSQLRAGRSGRGRESFFRHVAILGIIDAVLFVVSASVGAFILSVIQGLPAAEASGVSNLILEVLVFVPVLVPSAVLVAGVLFELGTSTKFASSDSVNWLPVSQIEYVTASTLSVAYNYSLVPSIIMGLTLWPSISLSYGATWVEMAALSGVSLFYAGAIVEIMRAAINRVTSVVMRRARRGALVLRLAATVGLILLVEVIFNFVFLIDLVGKFSTALSSVAFIPILWASLAVRASEVGSLSQNIIFSAAAVLFTCAMLWLAVKVRSRFWSPTPSQVSVTHQEYVPASGSSSGLSIFGLSGAEATLVKKDIKGLTRRRELLQYFAIPFVLAIVFVFEIFLGPGQTTGAGQGGSGLIAVYFVGGLFGLIISSISFGQEGRSAPLLYSLPLSPKQVLRAKMFTSTLLAVLATVFIFIVIAALSRPSLLVAIEDFVLAMAITLEEVCIGTAFGAKYPDFQERPRPRFVDPFGIIAMIIVGLTVMFVTASPALVSSALSSQPALQSKLQPLFLASLAFAAAVIGLSYRWASRATNKLFVEFKQ